MPELLLEFLGKPLGPSRFLGTNGLLVHHGQGHGVAPADAMGSRQCITLGGLGKEAKGRAARRQTCNACGVRSGSAGRLAGFSPRRPSLPPAWKAEVFRRFRASLAGAAAGFGRTRQFAPHFPPWGSL